MVSIGETPQPDWIDEFAIQAESAAQRRSRMTGETNATDSARPSTAGNIKADSDEAKGCLYSLCRDIF